MSDSEISQNEEAENVEESEATEAETAGTEASETGAQPEVAPVEESGEERRKTYRLNKVLGATITSSEGSEKSTRLFVIDISATGFRATDHQAPEQDECDISIVLKKNEEPFASRMRVVWVKELTVSGMYQMGCEFIDPSPEESKKLIDFIESESNKVAPSSGVTISIGSPWTMT